MPRRAVPAPEFLDFLNPRTDPCVPTLNRRSDGGYYILNHHHDHHTWQIVGDGVRHLERRGIQVGQFFPTDLFMQLYMNGWVYTGESRSRTGALRAIKALAPHELEQAIKTFHSSRGERMACLQHSPLSWVARRRTMRERT